MKRLTVIAIVIGSLLIASSVFAIEKKESGKVVTPAPRETKQKAGKSTQTPVKKVAPKNVPSRDYDDFIDKNGNGIDDRIEARQQKQPVEQKVRVDSARAKPEAK